MLSVSIASPATLTLPPKPKSSIPKTSFTGVRIQHLCPQRLPSQATFFRQPSPSSSVVMMAKREEEMKEIRAKTTEEINDEVVELKGELLMLRLQKSVRNEFKSSEFGRMRKRVYSFFPPHFIDCETRPCWKKERREAGGRIGYASGGFGNLSLRNLLLLAGFLLLSSLFSSKRKNFHVKRIARMLTVKRERELEEGINKRLSRKLDRQWKKSIVVKPPPSLIKLREQEAAEEAEKSAA
ncbi:hypothetical protein Gorai_019401 [Gossypium raimondii]|uniref:Large ribosomal subunit protein uL29c n=1 Tax=Gossypium raimondii TaxID=29730 RepID=A0A7J8PNK8_GOSRA|nr:hypothetical protein [Gossypium raimondii]